MAWLPSFLLGVPGQEYSFDLPPAAMNMTEGPVQVVQQNMGGFLRKNVFENNYKPTAKLNSNYLTLSQKQLFASLAGLDMFLSFQTRDDWFLMEKDYPSDTTTIVLRQNSITRLDDELLAASAVTQISIVGVYDKWAMTGTNYYTGGSYAASAHEITLGTPCSGTADMYVKYSFKGFLCHMNPINTLAQGGWVDKFQYDFELEGA